MTIYKHLNELIRDGMDLKLQCRRCGHIERADPVDAKNHIAGSRRYGRFLGNAAEPDVTLERCVDGLDCAICGATDFKVDAVKPLKSDDPDED